MSVQEHGSVAGYRSGCRGSQCPAPVACREVHRRYNGDVEFRRRIDAGGMLEYTNYAGNWYGTPLDELEQKLVGDNVVVLIIEVQGAHNVKKHFPDSLCVFIVPPSIEALRERLRKRSTESDEEIERRIAIAAKELEELHFYDASIKNVVAADCAQQLSDVIDEWQRKDSIGKKEKGTC